MTLYLIQAHQNANIYGYVRLTYPAYPGISHLAIKAPLVDLHDIITISESHLHAGIPNNVFTQEVFQDIFRKDRSVQDGAVAVFFIRYTIDYKQIYKYEIPDLEAIWGSNK